MYQSENASKTTTTTYIKIPTCCDALYLIPSSSLSK